MNIGPEPINTPLHWNGINRSTALNQTPVDGASQKLISNLPIETNPTETIYTRVLKIVGLRKKQTTSKNSMKRNSILPNETIKKFAVRNENLSQYTWLQKYENDRNSEDDFNTTITKNCNEKESITPISRTRYIIPKIRRQTRASGNLNETRGNRKF